MVRLCLAAVPLLAASPLAAELPQSIGPFGGSAVTIQFDSRHPGTLVAATSNALLFRSTNDGDEWTVIPSPAALRATLHAFTISPKTGRYLIGLADDTGQFSGLFQSDDEGRSWARIGGLGQRDVWSIAMFELDSRVIAAGTSEGVFLTKDGGESWARISPESNRALMPVVSLAFDPLDSQIIYAGTPHLPWITADGGETWRSAASGMEDDSDVFSILVLQPLRHVFAAACSGIYRSLDRGSTWTKLREADGASYRTYQIVQHPTIHNVLFAGTAHGLVRSNDGGATWRRWSTHPTRWIAFDPRRPERIYIATDEAGLFRSDDLGVTLKPINQGFSNRRVLSIASDGETLYAASGVGIYRCKGPQASWEMLSQAPADGPAFKIVPITDSRLFALTSKFILYSNDGGRTWSRRSTPPAKSRLTDLLPPSPGRPRLVVSSGDAIFYRNNGGASWHPAHLPKIDGEIRSLVAIGSSSAAAITRSMLLLSADGITYQAVGSPADGGELYAVLATDLGALLVATSHGLKRSDDAGLNWQNVDSVLGGNTVSTVCKHPTQSGVVYASRYGAIFGSSDDGRSWIRLTSEQEELLAIQELIPAPDGSFRLFALTHSQGIFTISVDRTLLLGQTRSRALTPVHIPFWP